MNSNPYNVIFTRDPKLIDDIFFGKLKDNYKLGSLVKRLNKDPDSLIFSPTSNKEFIGLDYSFGGQGNSFVSVRMLETDRMLELFQIAPNGWQESVIRRLEERRVIGGLKSDIDFISRVRPVYYITFGFGDDVRTWTGPFAIHLQDANLRLTEDGVRELELLFTPSMDSLKVFTNKILYDAATRVGDSPFDTREASQAIRDENVASVKFPIDSKQSREILLPLSRGEDRDILTKFYDAIDDSLEYIGWLDLKNSKDIPIERYVGVPSVYGDTFRAWNFAVRKLIGSYLDKTFTNVPGGNILVLFDDDLDAIPKARYLSGLGDLKVYTADPGIIEQNPATLSRNLRDKSDTQLAQAIAKTSALSRTAESLELLGISFSYPRPEENTTTSGKAEPKDTSRKSTILKNTTGDSKAKVAALEGIDVYVNTMGGGKWVQSFIVPPINPDALAELQAKVQTEFYLSMGVDIEATDREDPILIRPLEKFQRRVSQFSNKTNDFTLIVENNANLQKFLYEAGIIENKDESVVIFGRKNIINKLIYTQQKSIDESLLNKLDPFNSKLAAIGETERRELKGILGAIETNQDIDKADKDLTKKLPDWNKYQRLFKDFYSQNKKFKTSSFQEKPFIPLVRMKGKSEKMETYVGNKLISDNALLFAHNVRGSNVLDINFDSKPYVGVLMDRASEATYKLIDRYVDKDYRQVLRDETLNSEFMIELTNQLKSRGVDGTDRKSVVKNVIDVIKDRSNNTLKLLSEDPLLQVDTASFIDLVFFKLLGPRGITRKTEQGKIMKTEADLIQRINKSIIKVNIKTLPFFNSDIFIGQPCFLYGERNTVVGSKLFKGEGERQSIFTNNYTIISYKHVLNANEAYSEFTLIQEGTAEFQEIPIALGEFFQKELDALRKEEEAQGKKPEEVGLLDSVFRYFSGLTGKEMSLGEFTSRFGRDFSDGMASVNRWLNS
jgi:hypothetical protein